MIIEGFYVDFEGQKKHGAISIDNGIISRISPPSGKPDYAFSPDCLIFPGFIDLHVHSREDRTEKWSYKEDFHSAGEAAVNGGVTLFMEMPNTPEPVVTEEQVESRRMLAKKSKVPVVICAGINAHSQPMDDVKNYKAYLTKSVGDLFFTSTRDFEHHIGMYKGKTIHVHCEDHSIIESDSSRPAEAEIKAVEETLAIAKKLGLKIHICHLSTKEALEMIIDAKDEGVDVTCEVTPHHLFFDKTNRDDFERKNLIKMNPPLREKEDRWELIEALKAGVIDVMATDHAPHTLEEKKESNPSGVPMLDTFGPFISWLIDEHKFSYKIVCEMVSENPARLLGLKYGRVEPGYPASFTVLNMKKPITITKEILKTKSGWSPFEGVTFPGSVEATIVNGKVYRINDGSR